MPYAPELLDRVTKAVRDVPDFWIRLNPERPVGEMYEVGWSPGDVEQGEDEPEVLVACADRREAGIVRERLQERAQAAAALAAAGVPEDSEP